MGNTAEVFYEDGGEDFLLEKGNGRGGIGSGPQILSLLNADTTQKLVELLKGLRLLVMYPKEIVFQE